MCLLRVTKWGLGSMCAGTHMDSVPRAWHKESAGQRHYFARCAACAAILERLWLYAHARTRAHAHARTYRHLRTNHGTHGTIRSNIVIYQVLYVCQSVCQACASVPT